MEGALAGAWQSAVRRHGPDPALWQARARAAVRARHMGYLESLDGLGSLDPGLDLPVPGITAVDGGTIRSQGGQAYTQWVPMHDPDLARTILPPGVSEHPGHPSRLAALEGWEKGRLYPAPLSRAAVERIAVLRRTLSRGDR